MEYLLTGGFLRASRKHFRYSESTDFCKPECAISNFFFFDLLVSFSYDYVVHSFSETGLVHCKHDAWYKYNLYTE